MHEIHARADAMGALWSPTALSFDQESRAVSWLGRRGGSAIQGERGGVATLSRRLQLSYATIGRGAAVQHVSVVHPGWHLRQ